MSARSQPRNENFLPHPYDYAMLHGDMLEGGSMAAKVREVAYVGLEAVLRLPKKSPFQTIENKSALRVI